ncbi:MAG: MFS transporter [Rhodospirillales bacterium]|nr:MFS transporter [Rhodospirillales bacterium]
MTPGTVVADISRRHAVRFIVLLGVVSLFADMTYEGARSITGPYLALLGASATVVGFVAGFGEFVGYALRLLSGYVSDRTGRYWAITIFGYCLNLLAVPLLALTGSWEAAAVLIIVERMGRAVRTPARDAMLSHAGSHTGLGWGFGLHEALDQIGAVLGPLIIAAVIAFEGGYRGGFAVLAVPAVLALVILFAARINYPRPRDFDLMPPDFTRRGLPRAFWVYLGAVALIAAGYADFPLVAYHFGKTGVMPAAWIPAVYAVAMAADAIAALLLGRWFDRVGLYAMAVATIGSALAAPLAFLGGPGLAVIGMALWGIGMGAQESIMRAAIAGFAPADRRGTAYGIFNAVYGVAWFAGSVTLGALYDRSIMALVVASVLLQAAALPVLVWLSRAAPGAGTK